MSVEHTIQARRAYRSLEPVEISEELIRDLAESAQLAPSCNNNQPWRFVFVHDPEVLAVAFVMLRATELGLVAHPVAGYNEETVKEILGIPEEMQVITLVNVGKHSETIGPLLSEKQAEREMTRPERLPLEEFAYVNGVK